MNYNARNLFIKSVADIHTKYLSYKYSKRKLLNMINNNNRIYYAKRSFEFLKMRALSEKNGLNSKLSQYKENINLFSIHTHNKNIKMVSSRNKSFNIKDKVVMEGMMDYYEKYKI